jgi:phosphoribosylformimino-5-aminoimidazole carboxamide ribotide isomerase
MRFRPCIDLHNGLVKQIVGSTYRDTGETGMVTNFATAVSPAFFADLYRKDNLSGGHIIMLGRGNESAAREALAAWPGGMQVGGGITPDTARMWLDAGASHVIMTSHVFRNGAIDWDNLADAVKRMGRQRLVLDISCKKVDNRYLVATDRWQTLSTVAVDAALLDRLGGSCDEFLVHAADVEGKQGGIAEDLVTLLGGASPLPVTYAGGIRSLADLDRIDALGNGRVDATIGSALDIFGGKLGYREVVAWHEKKNRGL